MRGLKLWRCTIRFSLLILFFVSFSSALLANQNTPQRFEITDRKGSKIEIRETLLIGHDGNTVNLSTLFHDKPVIISPIFYKCPDICGFVLNGMLDSFKELGFVAGHDFDVITYSIDPKETSELARLKREATLNNLKQIKPNSDWLFFTGEESNIQRLSEQLGFQYQLDPATGLYSHAPGIFVADKNGVIIASIADVMYPKEILEYALVKASHGKLGNWQQKFNSIWRKYDFEKNELKIDNLKISFLILATISLLLIAFKVIKMWKAKNAER